MSGSEVRIATYPMKQHMEREDTSQRRGFVTLSRQSLVLTRTGWPGRELLADHLTLANQFESIPAASHKTSSLLCGSWCVSWPPPLSAQYSRINERWMDDLYYALPLRVAILKLRLLEAQPPGRWWAVLTTFCLPMVGSQVLLLAWMHSEPP